MSLEQSLCKCSFITAQVYSFFKVTEKTLLPSHIFPLNTQVKTTWGHATCTICPSLWQKFSYIVYTVTVWGSFRGSSALRETCAHLTKPKTLHAPCALPLKSMNASGLPHWNRPTTHDHSSAKACATDGEIVATLWPKLHLPVMVTNSPVYWCFIPGLGHCPLSDILTDDDYWQDETACLRATWSRNYYYYYYIYLFTLSVYS